MNAKLKVTIHRDRVRYWSVYRQQWVTEPAATVPMQERVVMPESDRHRIRMAAIGGKT